MVNRKIIAELALTAKRAYVGTTEEQACSAVEELASLVSQAWDEGFDEAMDDLGAAASMAEHGEDLNPYREAVEAPVQDRRRVPCTADQDCILWDGHNGACLS